MTVRRNGKKRRSLPTVVFPLAKLELAAVTAQILEMTQTRECGSDPLRTARQGIRNKKCHKQLAKAALCEDARNTDSSTGTTAAAARQNAQLPGFAPLLEELEVAGWSSHRRALSGNFHDWMLIERRTLLVVAGYVSGGESVDPIEAALVAQAAWSAIRSHAHHASEAGTLLSLTARSVWPIASGQLQASVAVAMVDLDGGHASVALAGDCLALKIRAAETEQIAVNQPAIGSAGEFTYPSHCVQLSLRDRILLVADDCARRPAKLASKISSGFSQLGAETHRRMMAADAVGLVREFYDEQTEGEAGTSASIVAVRRR